MDAPQYIPQKHNSACSLAVLRMVLATKGISVSEEELIQKVEKDYGKDFKNIWNPTIAKLAREYGIDTTMYALWPLFEKNNLQQAIKKYTENPKSFSIAKYENKNDTDEFPEPLPLSYKEMFAAIKLGCKTVYGNLTTEEMKSLLKNNHLIQTSVHLDKLYPGKNKSFHSILIYGSKDDDVFFHDPANGKSLSCSFTQLMQAMLDVGAAIVYKVEA